MDFILSLFLKIGLLAIAVGGVFVSHKYLKTKDDDQVEEMVEQIIKDQTGIEIDLTPETHEITPVLEGHEKDLI